MVKLILAVAMLVVFSGGSVWNPGTVHSAAAVTLEVVNNPVPEGSPIQIYGEGYDTQADTVTYIQVLNIHGFAVLHIDPSTLLTSEGIIDGTVDGTETLPSGDYWVVVAQDLKRGGKNADINIARAFSVVCP